MVRDGSAPRPLIDHDWCPLFCDIEVRRVLFETFSASLHAWCSEARQDIYYGQGLLFMVVLMMLLIFGYPSELLPERRIGMP